MRSSPIDRWRGEEKEDGRKEEGKGREGAAYSFIPSVLVVGIGICARIAGV